MYKYLIHQKLQWFLLWIEWMETPRWNENAPIWSAEGGRFWCGLRGVLTFSLAPYRSKATPGLRREGEALLQTLVSDASGWGKSRWWILPGPEKLADYSCTIYRKSRSWEKATWPEISNYRSRKTFLTGVMQKVYSDRCRPKIVLCGEAYRKREGVMACRQTQDPTSTADHRTGPP